MSSYKIIKKLYKTETKKFIFRWLYQNNYGMKSSSNGIPHLTTDNIRFQLIMASKYPQGFIFDADVSDRLYRDYFSFVL